MQGASCPREELSSPEWFLALVWSYPSLLFARASGYRAQHKKGGLLCPLVTYPFAPI